jgi:hypothetical protein
LLGIAQRCTTMLKNYTEKYLGSLVKSFEDFKQLVFNATSKKLPTA